MNDTQILTPGKPITRTGFVKDGSTIQREYAPKIVKLMEKACGYGGQSMYNTFYDWVQLARMTTQRMPAHLTSAMKGEPLTPDPPEMQKEWGAIAARYKPDQMDLFGEALGLLLLSAADGYSDVIGHTFETLEIIGRSNPSGLFLTPWNVSYMMAQMLNPGADCYQRVKEALTHPENIAGQALLLAGGIAGQGLDLDSEWAYEYFITKLLPAALPYIKPVTVLEPCCGSGGMILSACAVTPRWAVDTGIIQFFGMDINPLCVAMCQTNVNLYGVNGAYIRNGLELPEQELIAIPEPWQAGTRLIKEAVESGNQEAARVIEMDLRSSQAAFDASKYVQASMQLE